MRRAASSIDGWWRGLIECIDDEEQMIVMFVEMIAHIRNEDFGPL